MGVCGRQARGKACGGHTTNKNPVSGKVNGHREGALTRGQRVIRQCARGNKYKEGEWWGRARG